MFSSAFKASVAKLCQHRSIVTTLDGVATNYTLEELNRCEKEISTPEGIWHNEESVGLKGNVIEFIKRRISVAAHTLPHGVKVEDAVQVLMESVKGVLVPPTTSSPLLKHYTSFVEKLDSCTDLANIPEECKRCILGMD